jgi:hypothetical protein
MRVYNSQSKLSISLNDLDQVVSVMEKHCVFMLVQIKFLPLRV